MTQEESIVNDLTAKFGFTQDKIKTPRIRRIFAETDMAHFHKVFDYAINTLRFCILCTITGTDEGDRFGLIYHIAREDGIILNLKTYTPKSNPVIKTITDYFFAADIYERELMDLLGIIVEGLAEGKRYPLPDDWPTNEHPLRKDWKQSTSKVEGQPNA